MNKGYFFILLAVLAWSFVGIIVRLLHPYMNAESIIFYRSAIAAVALAGFIYLTGRAKLGELTKEKLGKYALLGFFYVGSSYTIIQAFILTKIADAQFLQQLAPAYTFLLAHFLLKEKAGKKSYYALVVALVGALLIFYFEIGSLGASLIGNVLAVASGVFLAGYHVAGRSARKYPAVEASAWAFILSSLATIPWAGGISMPVEAWLLLAALGIFSTALPFVLWIGALKYVKAQEASVLLLLTIVTIPVFAFLFFGEAPSVGALVGGALILSACAMILKR